MIKNINLQFGTYTKNYSVHGSDFLYETWYIQDYLSKSIAKEKFQYGKVKMLMIYIDEQKESIENEETFKSITYYSTYKGADILNTTGETRTEKILEIFNIAAEKYEKFVPGIEKCIKNAVIEFRKSGYKHIWLFQKKRVDKERTAKLICELTSKEFILSLVVSTKQEDIYSQEILKTLPDSIFYYDEFKQLKIEEDMILVFNRQDEVMFEISIDDINVNGSNKLILEPGEHCVFAQ